MTAVYIIVAIHMAEKSTNMHITFIDPDIFRFFTVNRINGRIVSYLVGNSSLDLGIPSLFATGILKNVGNTRLNEI